MGLTVGVTTATCDCCGLSMNPATLDKYVVVIGQVLCTANNCAAAHTADLLTGSFNLNKNRHLALGSPTTTAHPSLPNTCDCCGFVFDPTAAGTFVYDEVLAKTLCTAKLCASKCSTELLTGSFNATKLTHTTLIIAGVIPNHP